MASKPLQNEAKAAWSGPRVDFASFSAKLAERRAAFGTEIATPRNAGAHRTESKKALLRAIEDLGGKW